jgi:glutamate carboxypeptidase
LAHSGRNSSNGTSAIEEPSRKIQAIHALTDFDCDITPTVGPISGGQSVDTVTRGPIDLRHIDPDD